MQAERVEPGAGGARFRALVVDDEPPLVQVVSGYLSREGFDVLTAGDGNMPSTCHTYSTGCTEPTRPAAAPPEAAASA